MPTIFALIVAINQVGFPATLISMMYLTDELYQYDSEPKPKAESDNLEAAISDAELFKKFLTDPPREGGLGVSDDEIHIRCLYNGDAKRAAILDAFKAHFLENSAIKREDRPAIIFFFAGHGCRVYHQGYYGPDSHFEGICAQDRAIPDFIFIQKLRELADKKGDNITIILDSCCSGGMAREEKKTANSTIREGPDQPLQEDDFSMLSTIPTRYDLWRPFANTHILLAACGPLEKAYENEFAGRFTKKLVDAMRKTICAGKNITCVELMDEINNPPIPNQRPRCVGAFTDRLVFTVNPSAPGLRTLALTKVYVLKADGDGKSRVHQAMPFTVSQAPQPGGLPGVDKTLTAEVVTGELIVLVSRDPLGLIPGSVALAQLTRTLEESFPITLREQSSSTAFLARVGSLAGVREGMEFPLHDKTLNGKTCTFVAKIVGIDVTILDLPENTDVTVGDIPDSSCVVVSNWKEQVYIVMPSDIPLQNTSGRFKQVNSPAIAHIAVEMENEKFVLKRRQGTTANFASETRFSLPSNLDLSIVMRGVAHFYYFLELQNTDTAFCPGSFALEMVRMNRGKPIDDSNVIKPEGSDKKSNLYKAELTSDNTEFGFTIQNNATNQELFPYIFYFDPDGYTIKVGFPSHAASCNDTLCGLQCWYHPDGARGEPPLRRRGEINVGMGSEEPFLFKLPPNTTSSTGFLKLFVSTEHLDLKWIVQTASPWTPEFQLMMAGRLDGFQGTPKRTSDWAALQVVLTMKKGE
ncbi:hypothetical protein B0H13DRAFT_1874395 [Mycena leptocephala]|nr:hypothetical protein B0H13DRAFT_1874395 [Mycena leptocephala]